MNEIVLVGRITKDSELMYLPNSGVAICKFTIAVDRDYKKDGQKVTDFINCSISGKYAETMSQYILKGKQTALRGSLRIDNKKDQEGNYKTYTYINVDKVNPFLAPTAAQNNNYGNEFAEDAGENMPW